MGSLGRGALLASVDSNGYAIMMGRWWAMASFVGRSSFHRSFHRCWIQSNAPLVGAKFFSENDGRRLLFFFFSFAAGPIIFHDVVLFLERVRLKKLHSSRAKWIHFYLCYKLNEKIIYFSKTSTGGKLNCWCKLLGDRDRADSVKGTAEKGKEYFIRPTGNTGRFLHQRWTFSLWESTVPWTAKRGQLVYFSTYPLPQFQRMAFLFYLQNINSRS